MPEATETIVGAGNEGLTFIWVPQLFAQIPAGDLFMVFFFLALVFAAWSSLIAMIELATRVLMDAGLTRKRAIMMVGIAGVDSGMVRPASGSARWPGSRLQRRRPATPAP